MRILMTTDTVGGVWTYAIDLARALAPHGVQFVLATMGDAPSEAQRQQAAELPNVALRESAFKLEWMAEPWDDVERAGEWLLELDREYRPDVVHLNGYAHGKLPFSAPVLVVGHSCVLSWWEAVKDERAPADEWARYQEALTAGLAAANAVVTPSRAMMASLIRHYGSMPVTHVIHNARDASRYRVGEKELFVLSAGRIWDEAKNVNALIAAAPRIAWPVYVAGGDRHPDGGQQPMANVEALGRLDERTLAGWYSRAAIYALPARYEPFGLSALEAALSGCALVLGDVPSLREVWQDAAIYVLPNDTDALVDALNLLIHDPGTLANYATRALAKAREYSLERVATEYLAVYHEMIARRCAAAAEGAHPCVS